MARIIHTTRLLRRHQGRFLWPFILVHPDHADDIGLLVHEQTHERQFRRTWGFYLLLNLIPRYRLRFEVEAYRAQAACYPDDRRPLFARFIAERYRLDISPEAALRLLTDA